jgi:hypothetical protein
MYKYISITFLFVLLNNIILLQANPFPQKGFTLPPSKKMVTFQSTRQKRKTILSEPSIVTKLPSPTMRSIFTGLTLGTLKLGATLGLKKFFIFKDSLRDLTNMGLIIVATLLIQSAYKDFSQEISDINHKNLKKNQQTSSSNNKKSLTNPSLWNEGKKLKSFFLGTTKAGAAISLSLFSLLLLHKAHNIDYIYSSFFLLLATLLTHSSYRDFVEGFSTSKDSKILKLPLRLEKEKL